MHHPCCYLITFIILQNGNVAQVGDTPGTVTIKMSLFSSKSTPHPTAAYWFLPSPNSCSCQLILGFISLTLWERHWSINRAGTAEFQTTPCISIFNKVSCPFVGILLHHHHWNPAPSVVLCFNHISKCFFFPAVNGSGYSIWDKLMMPNGVSTWYII